LSTLSHRPGPGARTLGVLPPLLILTTLGLGCSSPQPTTVRYPPAAQKWFDRARESYRQADVDDAAVAVENALRVSPDREEVRMLGARIALARLEYDRCLELSRGITTVEARGIRGRALWYAGRVEQAADELEALLVDPEVRDPWARDIARLARRGAGRRPFEMSGGILAVTQMPQVSGTSLVVPLEVNGEGALGMIATNVSEAVIDGSADGEPQWISLRFGQRVEIKDVPALSRDLSGVSRQLNAPIKVLVGVNLLRHLHATFDLPGGQFVVRRTDPPAPPYATTLKLNYAKGGGMVVRAALRGEQDAPLAALMVDTTVTYPLALDESGWKKAGIAPSKLGPIPNSSTLKQALVPLVKVGAFEVTQVMAVAGAPMVSQLKAGLDMELDGLIGSGLLAAFRVTLVDGGRTMWLEPMPQATPHQSSPSSESGDVGGLEPPMIDVEGGLGESSVGIPPAKGAPPGKEGLPAGKTPVLTPAVDKRAAPAPPRTPAPTHPASTPGNQPPGNVPGAPKTAPPSANPPSGVR
jgi:hypothetical protein